MSAPRKPATRVVHAGMPAADQGAPLMPGPVLAAPFHLAGPADASPYGYARYANPTWTAYEAALEDLEGGPALVFSSGMAAVSSILLGLLGPGDVLVAPSDGYGVLRDVASNDLEPGGCEVRLVPSSADAIRGALDGATLVWIETPSNPDLHVLDVAALARDAHAAGALLAVDNTVATPLVQQPLALGADLSMASATKALSGHSDLLIGHVATRDDALRERLHGWRSRVGAIAGPFETWLAHRSLVTLDVRVRRQCANALAVASALREDGRVANVRYPGLADHPGHEVAARQMGGLFGPVLTFELPDADAAQAFLSACSLVAEATSFGGAHTTAERRARWGDAVPEGLVRFSCGLEDPSDLVADVLGALG